MPGHGHRGRRARRIPVDISPAAVVEDVVNPLFFDNPAITHTQSKTWKSKEARDRGQFSRLNSLLCHFVPASPYTPKTHAEWIEHRAGLNDMEKEEIIRNIEIRQARSRTVHLQLPIVSAFGPVGGSFKFLDNRSAILAQTTIWAPWSRPAADRPYAPWPDRTELTYEGDGRAKTSMARFLPLLRRPGNETASWKTRPRLDPYKGIDSVWVEPGNVPAKRVIKAINEQMDKDPDFMQVGMSYLGNDLMALL